MKLCLLSTETGGPGDVFSNLMKELYLTSCIDSEDKSGLGSVFVNAPQ